MTERAANAAAFDGLTCSAPDARANRMAAIVLEQVPNGDAPLRVLDLGCGTGGLIFRLAAALPRATCVGIDISPCSQRPTRRIAASVADVRVARSAFRTTVNALL